MKKLLTEKELATELGISFWTVRNWRLKLGLPHFRTAGRIFYRWEPVMKWMEDQEKKTIAAQSQDVLSIAQ